MRINEGECDGSTSANRISYVAGAREDDDHPVPKGPYGWQPVMPGPCRSAEGGQFESARPLELREKKNAD